MQNTKKKLSVNISLLFIKLLITKDELTGGA